MIIFTLFTLVITYNESLLIQNPQELANLVDLEQIKFSIANFGFVPYGQSISGVLEVAQPYTFCTPKLNSTIDLNNDHSNVKILLVQRGDCPFTIKVINAQSYGYQAVVIVDNTDIDITNVMLISDNDKNEIDIPTILISKKQGNLIKQYMDANANESVYIVVKFPDLLKTDIVTYQYWFTATYKYDYQFLQQFYPFHMEMKDQLEFTPGYQLITCLSCEKQNYSKPIQACLSGGRYCQFDPDGVGPLNGQDVVREVVRQLCIFIQDKVKWWNYVIKYSNQCLSNNCTPSCSSDIMNKVGIDADEVQACYVKSFNNRSDELEDNQLLHEQYQAMFQYSINGQPTLNINGFKYRGSLTISNQNKINETDDQQLLDTTHFGPLQTICRSFKDQSLPNICKKRLLFAIDEELTLVERPSNSSTWVLLVVILFTTAFLMICTTFLYKRMFRKVTNEQINQKVNINLTQLEENIRN